jgi:mannitol-1-phosphate 5-dehydrogenase
VGAGALPAVLKTIAASVQNRQTPLDIILAENLKGAAKLVHETFRAAGIGDQEIEARLGIIETSIGKMVPLMPPEVSAGDPLLSWAEPFNTLIVDRDGFRGSVPEIPDLMAVSPIAPWVARKLFIHNFGHAATAYLGYQNHPEASFIWEVLADSALEGKVGAAMRVAGEALRAEYPGTFTQHEMEEHITDLLHRFSNRALGDTVYRVGRDLARKLKRNDRVAGVIALALKHGLDTGPALEVFHAALEFRAPGPDGTADKGDLVVLEARNRPADFIRDVVGIDENTEPELARILSVELIR